MLIGVAGAAVLVPRRVSYTESVVIAAAQRDVYDHIRLQARLMRWSAWPVETGSSCACEGIDGEVGARTVFYTRAGKRFGHQEVISLVPGQRVVLGLVSKGPPQRPVLTFDLEPFEGNQTHVVLTFDNRIMPPFNVILRIAGVVQWTRNMHLKDLQGLKAYSEPPHRTYAGEPADELMTLAA